MRLQKIRLAGFKSFVDPTSITFPSELVGVVGPNGCGKSNVIDAVRWVMGELSAKHLRGDSMADVVFSGSNSRQPIGQASVELIFDNSEGRLGGQYANYTEISVKRQVARDTPQSVYFLNGTRCRRRDVTDLFHGTGLGPRSYAIIEQGMISRLIEAKPEELREFLEEAAGISRYKERRRETENRIGRTQENIDRINDLREELGKRLTHLKRQATMAEKYRVLKEEERGLRAELLGLRWRGLNMECNGHESRVQEQVNRLESVVAELRRVETALEKERVQQSDFTDAFNETYRKVLDAGAEIARVEESIQHLRERREQLQRSLAEEETTLGAAREHLQSEQQRLQALDVELEQRAPDLERLRRDETAARDALSNSEDAMHEWQSEWQLLSEKAARPTEAAHTERARIEQLEQHTGQLDSRVARLSEELAALRPDTLETELQTLTAQSQTREQALRVRESGLKTKQAAIQRLRTTVDQRADALHNAQAELQTSRGRCASLEALQQDALGKRQELVVGWLQDRGLGEAPRLAEQLDVEPGWERALETVLGSHLEAVCVDSIDSAAAQLSTLDHGVLTLLDVSHTPSGAEQDRPSLVPLRSMVRAPTAVGGLLDGVYAVGSLETAIALRATLAPGESAVTADGLWVGANWVRTARGGEEHQGILERGQELKQLADLCAASEAAVERLGGALHSDRASLEELESELAETQSTQAEEQRSQAGLQSRVAATQAELEQARSRRSAISDELNEISGQADSDQRAVREARARLEQALDELQRVGDERDAWSEQRAKRRQNLDQSRERWQAVHDDVYQVGLRTESTRATLESLRESVTRNQDHVTHLTSRCSELRGSLAGTTAPLEEATGSLNEKLEARRGLDEELKSSRAKVEGSEGSLRELEQSRGTAERAVDDQRAVADNLRMQAQETHVRRKTVEEQLVTEGHVLEELLERVSEEATEEEWGERLDVLERRITRLGPINLAAIDEYEQQSERKSYLDAQHTDLTDALDTLEQAMRKIDRETRARFKDTYDKVNSGLGEMFPRLFGGGHATLEMTGDDLLSAGVAVMARPPGKRNTSIHLLSGGEKALTAVALVFSIFELNPAPFCLLDEVDAPLDDANVGRFCDMVKGMSERVQFVLVTHNKATMEMTQQLIGVTMHEPGVSRLVAVDVDEAVELAQAV
jgi:chromosome segregation protein